MMNTHQEHTEKSSTGFRLGRSSMYWGQAFLYGGCNWLPLLEGYRNSMGFLLPYFKLYNLIHINYIRAIYSISSDMYEEVWKTVSTLELVNSSQSRYLVLIICVFCVFSGCKDYVCFSRSPNSNVTYTMYFEYVVGMYSNF